VSEYLFWYRLIRVVPDKGHKMAVTVVDRKDIQPVKHLHHLPTGILFQNRWRQKTGN